MQLSPMKQSSLRRRKLGPGKISMLPTKWNEVRSLTCRSAGLKHGLNPYAPHAYGLGMKRRHENGGKGA